MYVVDKVTVPVWSPGLYLYRASPAECTPHIHTSVFWFWLHPIILVPCTLPFMGFGVLLKWLLVNTNMKLCLSFLWFMQEGAHQPATPTLVIISHPYALKVLQDPPLMLRVYHSSETVVNP